MTRSCGRREGLGELVDVVASVSRLISGEVSGIDLAPLRVDSGARAVLRAHEQLDDAAMRVHDALRELHRIAFRVPPLRGQGILVVGRDRRTILFDAALDAVGEDLGAVGEVAEDFDRRPFTETRRAEPVRRDRAHDPSERRCVVGEQERGVLVVGQAVHGVHVTQVLREAYDLPRRFADEGRRRNGDDDTMRDLCVGALALGALILVAVAPSWERTHGNSATLPTATLAQSAQPAATPISRSFDPSAALAVGPGFAICGASDTWRRPTVQQQSARVATDPRYRDLRFDDNSPVARQFRAAALMYDGAGSSSRAGLVMASGLWTEPRLGGVGCQTKEQQVWLFGYAPDSYQVIDGASAVLNVHEQPGFRMVVITGEPRRALVVFGKSQKLELLTMEVPVAAPSTPVVAAFPMSARPLELTLLPSCAIVSSYRHTDDSGNTWYVQCGVGKVNVSIPGDAVSQGWTLLGAEAPDGMQLLHKGALWMQISYRRDGAGINDPFEILQTYRPLVFSPAPRPTP